MEDLPVICTSRSLFRTTAVSNGWGDDLYLTVPLNLYTAVLGGEQIIDTLDSKVKLKVKPGTQNNTKVRLKGKGIPLFTRRRGSLVT